MPAFQFDSFQKADKKIWTTRAQKELEGKDPFESLSVSKHGIHIKPYYDATDIKHLSIDILPPSNDPYLGPRTWHNTPIVNVENAKEANKQALNLLNNGADGIIFKIGVTIRMADLLNGIELPYCSTFFLIDNEHSKLLIEFEQFVIAKGFDKAQIVGGAFWESMPVGINDLMLLFEKWGKFKVAGHMIKPCSDPTDDIANAIMLGVKLSDQLTDAGINASKALSQQAFSFTIGTDFFLEIAKLKTFRKLWHTVAGGYGTSIDHDSQLIHGQSTCWNTEKYQPNANMLKSTTAALSAILGGCFAITIEPEDETSSFKSRIARNVLTILREESRINLTADATAGAYYLESTIDQMAQLSWSKFQGKI